MEMNNIVYCYRDSLNHQLLGLLYDGHYYIIFYSYNKYIAKPITESLFNQLKLNGLIVLPNSLYKVVCYNDDKR